MNLRRAPSPFTAFRTLLVVSMGRRSLAAPFVVPRPMLSARGVRAQCRAQCHHPNSQR